ncbi:protoporphyrinogen oxidase [Virgibacillus xinjiangensis]|uniref:Coproporphyrinogen III oxidase n=1 Tax=Virgibacillus xinjiangensis TaxID=393090 RepID=A0ABV7CWG5_9BACI
MERKRIAIVGGGITGLSAAYYLQKEINDKKLPYEIKLIESGNRLGGKIKTLKQNGFTIEQGPDSLLARKQPALKLTKELGLEERVIHNGTGQSFMLMKRKLYQMPKEAFMGIPKTAKSIRSTKLISTTGKLRAMMEPFIPKGKKDGDQSLGEFFRRRFGDELLVNQVDSLLSGIHSGDIDRMSLKATYPMFHKLEQEYGSVMKGLRKTMPSPKKNASSKPASVFFSYEGGLGTLVERLEEELEEDNVQLNTSVDHIEKKENGYHLLLSDGTVYKADAVISTTPHSAVPRMFSQYDFFKVFNHVPSVSTANVVLAFDQSALKKDIDGTGFLVSRNSDYRITACTWTHKKWPNTAPEGKALLRCYVGRPGDEEIVDLSDDEITDIVLKDLRKVMKIKGKPEFTVITRWKNGRPQYHVGHVERLAEVRANMESHLPGVYLAGASYEGGGIPDCIEQGEQAVTNVLEFLK